MPSIELVAIKAGHTLKSKVLGGVFGSFVFFTRRKLNFIVISFDVGLMSETAFGGGFVYRSEFRFPNQLQLLVK